MENNNRFEELEAKIQGLIAAHQKLKNENEALKKENEHLVKAVETEKARVKWVEDGYISLQQTEKAKTEKTIKHLQVKVENIISEVDKSISLIENNE